MWSYALERFGTDGLVLGPAPVPEPGPGEIRLRVEALSLNYRDLLVVTGGYSRKLPLPVTPLSDAAGAVSGVGAGVSRVREGDRVMTHFVSGWLEGPFRGEYRTTTLGTPGPGLAAEQVVLPAEAVLPIPRGYTAAEAATLPIAALTAWSCLVTEGAVKPGHSVLTLGTGGVSCFTVQLGKALGARLLVTSRSRAKLARVHELGADETIASGDEDPHWERRVLELTGGRGVDLVVETGGAGTLARSLAAVRPGGIIAMPGSLAGLESRLNLGPLVMRRVRLQGILVDSRAAFQDLVGFLEEHAIRPVIDRCFPVEELPAALRALERAEHVGKIVLEA